MSKLPNPQCYFFGRDPSPISVLYKALSQANIGNVIPCGVSTQNLGVQDLVHIVVSTLPSVLGDSVFDISVHGFKDQRTLTPEDPLSHLAVFNLLTKKSL